MKKSGTVYKIHVESVDIHETNIQTMVNSKSKFTFQ